MLLAEYKFVCREQPDALMQVLKIGAPPVEWRTIPDFPKYQITADGDVRNRETKKILKELYNTNTSAYYYTLWGGGQGNHSRNYKSLVRNAWPELDKDWKDIPGFTGYQVNKQGQVRGIRWLNLLPCSGKDKTYRLRKNGVRHNWRVGDLDSNFWNEKELENVA